MELRRHGVTRLVILVGPWAVKLPRGLRGWLANESEWRQRRRSDVNRPLLTVLHLVAVYRRAAAVGTWDTDEYPPTLPLTGGGNDEMKGSSWGQFNGRWLLIDYDRAWQRPHSIIGRMYYGRQDRLARKWARLPHYTQGD